MDFYQILGVSKDTDIGTVKKVYRKLVKECHPDTHPGDRRAEERFKQISRAYAVLGNEEKRRQYDAKLVANGKKGEELGKGPQKPHGDAAPMRKKRGEPIDAQAMFERYMGFR